jgi:sulfite exporter TauE/SafE/copper chaperone CopZ
MPDRENSLIKKCTYFIDGMHCASCEVLIEKKLLKQDSVETAEASLNNNRVEFTYRGNRPTTEQLNRVFAENGYTFSERKLQHEKNMPFMQIKNGELLINESKLKRFFSTSIILLLLLALFWAVDKTGIATRISVGSGSSYVAFLGFGVIAGLSSCAALTGGLLLSLSKQWSEMYIDSDSLWQRSKPFAMFNIGRVISFFILGGVLGLVGKMLGISAFASSSFTAVFIIVVSLLMAVMGLQMLGVNWAQRFQIRAPKFLTHKVANEENFSGKYMPFLVGALTFLLPCGFTLVAQGLALTSGSFLTGALIMFFFALGTLPMLALIGVSSATVATKPKANLLFNTVAGLLVLVFAVYNFNAQLNLLGVPSLSDIDLTFAQEDGSTTEFAPINEDGVQVLSIVAEGFSYTPTSPTTLKAGVPAKLMVDNQGIQGCATYLAVRGLMNGYQELKPGENEIDLEDSKPGIYKITCSMGMVRPVTVKVI